MANRNPNKPHRHIEGNERRTQLRVDQYYGKNDLLRTWEMQPEDIQVKFHDEIIGLRARVRNVKNYLLHRADPNADL